MFSAYRGDLECNKPISKEQGSCIFHYAFCESKTKIRSFLIPWNLLYIPPYNRDNTMGYRDFYERKISNLTPRLCRADRERAIGMNEVATTKTHIVKTFVYSPQRITKLFQHYRQSGFINDWTRIGRRRATWAMEEGFLGTLRLHNRFLTMTKRAATPLGHRVRRHTGGDNRLMQVPVPIVLFVGWCSAFNFIVQDFIGPYGHNVTSTRMVTHTL